MVDIPTNPVIAYGCCVGDWQKFINNVKRDDRIVIAISGHDSIAKAYNKILDAACRHHVDLLILQHDDLKIIDPHAEQKFIESFKNDSVEIVGVAGGNASTGLAWWNDHPIGHQLVGNSLLDFGQRTGYVDILEGSILVFNRWAINHLNFDERYRGFHGYDEITMQLKPYGRKAYVADVDTQHFTHFGFDDKNSQDLWFEANQRFTEKWINNAS